jgi:hypothetical protein
MRNINPQHIMEIAIYDFKDEKLTLLSSFNFMLFIVP